MEQMRRFLDFILGEHEGIFYLATKNPRNFEWNQHYFEWPSEKEKVIETAKRSSFDEGLEVYYGPSLYRERRAIKANWMGTNVAWAEFDGNAPVVPRGPIPSLILRSSTNGHEHWYWKLESFHSSSEELERLNEKLTYALGADRSGWDCNQVLRLPGLKHQVKNVISEITSFQPELTYSVENFKDIPDPPKKDKTELPPVDKLPKIETILLTFRWTQESFDFFKTDKVPVGHRSSALTKLCYICLDMGMDKIETLTVLIHADDRWEKFKNRNDRMSRLNGIINYCRGRQQEKASASTGFGFQTFLKNTEKKVDWIVDGLVYRKALITLFGPAGVGKSLLSMQFCIQAGLGGPFVQWRVNRPIRTVFISMEMTYEEVKSGLEKMSSSLTEAEHDRLEENFIVVPAGVPIHMDAPTGQETIYRILQKYRPDGIIFDSLRMAVSKTDNDYTGIMFDFIQKVVRDEFGAFAWFIHHPRKGQPGNKKPRALDDIYGDVYIVNNSSTVMGLWKSSGTNVLSMSFLKSRLGPENKSELTLQRNPDTLLCISRNTVESSQPTKEESKQKEDPEKWRGM